jgi:transcriptional regulator with XRE-family HTH domain
MSDIIYSRDHRELIRKLKQIRLKANLRQEDVAKILHRTQSYVSKLESGQRKIDLIEIKKIAKIYKVDINYFIK